MTEGIFILRLVKLYIKRSSDHTISIAQTNEVVTKGMIRVNHCQWLIIARANAADEIKNTSHAAPRYFLF